MATMTEQQWTEVLREARCLAPTIPEQIWHDVELPLRGWSAAEQHVGPATPEEVAHYAALLHDLSCACQPR
jgi:hypothetical protein